MPDQAGRETNEHVKEYLDKKGVNPDDLGDKTHEALNSLSPEELAALDKVDAALEEDGEAPMKTARAVH